jgi:hypothetical protein
VTDLTELSTADHDLVKRVQDAVRPGQLGTALRDAAGLLGIVIDWHSADLLAEALSHHYETKVSTFVVLTSSVSSVIDEMAREQAGRELMYAVHEAGMGLVEEPEISWHTVDALLPSRRDDRPAAVPSLTADQLDEIALYRGRTDRHMVLVITGRCRRLAKPRAATPGGTNVH